MRLALLQADLPPAGAGGVAHQVDLLARTMVARGHDTTVFTAVPPGADKPYRVEVIERRGPAPTRFLVGVGLGFRHAPLRSFDVVHAHGDAWCLPSGPVVRTFHGTALDEARHATSWKRRLAQSGHYGLELLSSRRATVTTAVSVNTGRFMPGIDRVIPNAVDTTVFAPGDGRAPEPTVLLVAGHLGGRKRGSLVLDAFASLRQRLPAARLVIVTHDDVRADGVEVRRAVSTAELAELYRRAWVLCVASSYEAFGIPYVEALTSGLPVVTTANPGADEILRPGRLGDIVEPGGLCEALFAMLTDQDRADDFRRRGLVGAARYTLDSVAGAYESAYADAASA